jgi:hypothetical protein
MSDDKPKLPMPHIHAAHCTHVLDDHEGECPGISEREAAFREAVAAQRPVFVEGVMSTALLSGETHGSEFPTAEVILKNPDGTRVRVTIECPNPERYGLDTASIDAASAATRLMQQATEEVDSKDWKKR